MEQIQYFNFVVKNIFTKLWSSLIDKVVQFGKNKIEYSDARLLGGNVEQLDMEICDRQAVEIHWGNVSTHLVTEDMRFKGMTEEYGGSPQESSMKYQPDRES